MVIDYRTLSKPALMTAPIVAKYPEVIADVAGGSQWFSVLNLSNTFFAIPLHPDS